MRILESVPNFSDGRDPLVARTLKDALGSEPGVRLLDWHTDRDHNRSVATLVGEDAPLERALLAAMRAAIERIDLTRHDGVHPRMGAVDVVPLVPLEPDDMPRCVALARGLAERVGRELELPVYLYGEAALLPERRALPAVRPARAGGLEALAAALASDPARRPDRGPARLHPTAGAVAIGARDFLIAFNVVLESHDLELARRVARRVRESGGGLPGIRALGLALESQGRVQVSLNLCAPSRTGLVRVFEEVARLAAAEGVEVRGSELVGLAPRAHLDAEIARRVRLAGFEPARHVLEEALAR